MKALLKFLILLLSVTASAQTQPPLKWYDMQAIQTDSVIGRLNGLFVRTKVSSTSSGGGLSITQPSLGATSGTINLVFDGNRHYLPIVANGLITLTGSGSTEGAEVVVVITGNNNNTVLFQGNWKDVLGNRFDSTKQNVISAQYLSGKILYKIIPLPASDDIPPAISSIATNSGGTQIVFTFSEALKNVVPATSDFTLSGGKTFTAISLSGATVTGTLSSAYSGSDVITAGYTPGTNKIQDASGNLAVSFSSHSVTNNVSVNYHLSNFTAANGTLLTAYTPETGAAWVNDNGSTMEIQNNAAVTKTFGSDLQSIGVTDLGQTNYTLTAVVQTAGSTIAGIRFRYTNYTNHVVLNIDPTGTYSGLYNQVNGNFVPFGNVSTGTLSYNTDYTVKIIVSGSSVTVMLGTSNIGGGTIPGTQSGTKIAMAGSGAAGGVKFNSILVTP